MNFKSQNNEIYNKDFNLDELVEAIQLSHDSATGPDEIHYQMLKHLPDTSLETLLNIFNYIWTTGKFPEDWTLATIIPIPKPGKDPAEPNNYRPIALTSCLCKTLERMINKRLTWFLESNNHISRFQSGFRSDRSTTDNLVRLETFIRDAFIKKEHVVAVFFYLEKAYDTTWRYGILKDIHKLGLRGRLPTFIENFLADRIMQVRVGSSLSDYYDQEQGVPQGGVLSTTLFSIKINDIVKCLGNLTDCSLYVDDFCICYRSKSMATIERQLQQNLNKIENWATSNGFKFSKSKTQCVHFCQLHKQHDDPVLHLYGSPIPVVEESKFLGILFDRKLSFIPHIKYLKAKCLKALNLLKVLSHTSWGADRTTLLKLYRSLVRSKLDYGCIIYGSARKSYLQMLDPIHNQGLRLALGAFRTSPVASLYVEADEPSLYSRREKLSLQYAIRLDLDIDSNTPTSLDCKNSNYLYPSAGHVITGNLNVIPDARVRNIISKGPKYRFPSNIDFSKCRREIAASLNDFSNRWCKRENVEPDALKEWKINIFKIIDTRISFYSRNTHLLPPKPKSSFRHLKRGIQDFHLNYVLVPADKAANNVVVV